MEQDEVSVGGIRVGDFSAATAEHIISQIQRELDAEVANQNRSERNNHMRAVKSMAQTLRDAITGLKQATLDAQNEFQTEVSNGMVNVSKVKSMTQDLRDANKEVEQMLGQSGSNFTPDGSGITSKPDSNGVIVNK